MENLEQLNVFQIVFHVTEFADNKVVIPLISEESIPRLGTTAAVQSLCRSQQEQVFGKGEWNNQYKCKEQQQTQRIIQYHIVQYH